MPIKNSPQNARKNTQRTPRDIAKGICTVIENRLVAFIKADAYAEPVPVPEGKKPRKSPLMTGDQVHAALGLLKKYKPDLKSVQLSTDPDNPPVTEVRLTIIDPVKPSDSPSLPTAADPESL
jgi:hypothetical protein